MKPLSDYVNIPDVLQDKLAPSLHGEIVSLNRSVSEILVDNKLPFFPDYTDHGVRHISRLLHTITEHLIPADAMPLLSSEDAAIIICGALFHDLGMHLRERGLLDLISNKADHRPLPWFDKSTVERKADLSWPEAWLTFRADVKRYSDKDFHNVLGFVPSAADLTNWMDVNLPDNSTRWTQIDYRLIGEFVRQHHGRLSHEFAIFGFPGLPVAEFPILDKVVPRIADLAGLVARSHSLPLREAASYLSYKHSQELRPRGSVPLYLMALLRVGDYLQLDSDRAPSILFKLRSTSVPPSIDAWGQHGAIANLSYMLDDPVAIKIELTPSHPLIAHLQLDSLIRDLQLEIDTSSAVLSENYGRVAESGLDKLRLAKLRVHSNHSDPALLSQLPYFPDAVRLGADPQIVGLMVEPIYGQSPEYGVRELVQNACDAILEREVYTQNRNITDSNEDPAVLVELVEHPTEGTLLTITDGGIGMTPETIKDYFLKAGASFRNDRGWQQEFVSLEGKSTVRRCGRFGVGAFAGFLLGDEMEVKTRHLSSDHGYSFRVSLKSDLIELAREDLPVGTSVRIKLADDKAAKFANLSWPICVRWYGLGDPPVVFQRALAGTTEVLTQPVVVDHNDLSGTSLSWSSFQAEGFANVAWRNELREAGNEISVDFGDRQSRGDVNRASVYCNGFLVGAPDEPNTYGKGRVLKPATYSWPEEHCFYAPTIFVSDNDGALPLTLRRDELVAPLPFQRSLEQDMVLDFIAWCLAVAPNGPIWDSRHTSAYQAAYPLVRQRSRALYTFGWACSEDGVVPLDRSLVRALEVSALLVSGKIRTNPFDLADARRFGAHSDSPSTYLSGGWFANPPTSLGKTLVCCLAEAVMERARGDSSRYEGDDRTDARLIQGTMTDALVEHLSEIGLTGEFAALGAEIVLFGHQGRKEEVTAGKRIQTGSDLSSLIGEVPAVTRYPSWGDRHGGSWTESTFVGEIHVEPSFGPNVLSEFWPEILGGSMIPFDAKRRLALIKRAAKKFKLNDRISKFSRIQLSS